MCSTIQLSAAYSCRTDRLNKAVSSARIAARLVEWHLVGVAQPLAITMNDGVCLAVEVDQQHIQRRLETGYCDEIASTLDEALAQVKEACNTGQPLSIGLIGNAAEVYPELVRRGIIPAMVTDQTSAHDALNGYIPASLSLQEADALRKHDPQEYIRRSQESMVAQVQAMLEMQKMGAIVFDYGNNLRGQAFNELVAKGIVKAPIVIGRDHLDSGSVASPYRETEAMRDGSDAIADWPLLNALLNTASGATWVSIHHGGGVSIGYSIHAGQVIVADGTPEAAQRLERVLTNDPGIGVMRHVDAGYEEAIECARELGVNIPML